VVVETTVFSTILSVITLQVKRWRHESGVLHKLLFYLYEHLLRFVVIFQQHNIIIM